MKKHHETENQLPSAVSPNIYEMGPLRKKNKRIYPILKGWQRIGDFSGVWIVISGGDHLQ